MTLRFKCPACAHEQRKGGVCEACEVDFLKYATVMITDKKAESEREHDRMQERSGLLKSILWAPLSGGISILKYLMAGKDE
jgi:hypothetical protein